MSSSNLKNDSPSKNSCKQVVLFSTRFLEGNAALFAACSIVENAFYNNDAYCDFFLTDQANKEIKKYLFGSYILTCLKEKYPNEINVQSGFNPEIQKLSEKLSEKKKGKDFDAFEKSIKGLRVSFCKGEYPKRKIEDYSENHNNTETVEYVPKKELLRNHLFSCKDDETRRMLLDINCDNIEDYDISWRFKLYKLNLPANSQYSAYAVWSLAENIPHNEFKWYEALCQEIVNQESGNTIGEINLFLHDKDIDSTTFSVRYYHVDNSTEEFSFLPNDVKLNVALFQHNDPIGTILSTTPSDDQQKTELLNEALNILEREGKLSFLNKLSDCVARWHNGGKEEYLEEVEKRGPIYGLTSLIKENIDDNFVEKVLNEIKKLRVEIKCERQKCHQTNV